MDTETLLAIGGLVIGGFGALATAISAYLIGKSRNVVHEKKIDVEAEKVEVEEKKIEVEEKKVEVLERRIDLEHHEAIVAGYKDLIVQYQNARDIARKEVHDLRDVVGILSNKVELLTKQHETCQTENAELKVLLETTISELRTVRVGLAERKQTYGQSNTSATPESQTAA